jgi:hypothetical protein
MRTLILAMLTLGGVATAAPARAQIYDPSYPICLRVYERLNYYECSYTSLPQCQMSASGRAAQCVVNPYWANAYVNPSLRPHKRHRQVY